MAAAQLLLTFLLASSADGSSGDQAPGAPLVEPALAPEAPVEVDEPTRVRPLIVMGAGLLGLGPGLAFTGAVPLTAGIVLLDPNEAKVSVPVAYGLLIGGAAGMAAGAVVTAVGGMLVVVDTALE